MKAPTCWILIVLVVPSAACSANPDADNDLDGVGFNDDCDDFDPRAYPGADELCGGRDEDCDGRIDEGLPDLDGDGELDCDPDRSCEVRAVAPRRNQAEQTCPPARVEDHPWAMRQLWRWESDALRAGDVVEPDGIAHGIAVAENQEGRSTIYVLALAHSNGLHSDGTKAALVSLDAATGDVNWSRPGPWSPLTGIAAADIDDDGATEVVALQVIDADDMRRLHLAAVDEDNVMEWRSQPFCEVPCPEDVSERGRGECSDKDCFGMKPATFHGGPAAREVVLALTRLDGRTKVVLSYGVVDGSTGNTELILDFDWHRDKGTHLPPIVAHGLPGIGTGLFLTWSMYNSDLQMIWHRPPDFFSTIVSPVIIGSDSDDTLWISLFSSFGDLSRWHLMDAGSGEVHASRVTRSDWENELYFYASLGFTIADTDGDGVSEEVHGTIHKYGPRLDSTLTVNPSRDNPPLLTLRRDTDWRDTPYSFSAFDFDGNGTMEVVGRYRDRMFIVSNGEIVAHIGASLLGDGLRELSVYYDLGKPTVVADIDDDGHAEIVTHTSTFLQAPTGLAAFEHAGSGWMPAGSNWNQTPFRPEEFLEDGTVVGDPPVDYSLESGTMLNARPIAAPHAELELLLAGSCAASCAGEVRAALRVANHGATVVREGEVEAVVRDEDGQVVARAPVPPTARREQSELFELVVPDTGLLPSPDRMTIELAFAEPTAQCTTDDDTVTVELPPACAPLR